MPRISLRITPDMIKAEAGRRIDAEYKPWQQLNILNGKDESAKEQMRLRIDSIRDASNKLEKKPPSDYTNDKHWPK